MLKEFKEFAMRGNVVDLAVGLVVGAAFGKIVTSFTSDLLMPPLGLLLGRVNFSNLFIPLDGHHYGSLDLARRTGAPTLNYGVFLNTIIDFLIIAFAVFLVVRAMNKLTAPKETPAEAATRECPRCISKIPIKANRCPNCTSDIQATA
ncbi:MAG TPA: large conductance mechanosensitive channel protein MscL [Candidatus Binataceae bacterium]